LQSHTKSKALICVQINSHHEKKTFSGKGKKDYYDLTLVKIV